jgi:hypothetical protein
VPARTSRPYWQIVFLGIMFTSYCFVISGLQPLCAFRHGFCTSNPLFSTSYRLFCRNRGGVPPAPRSAARCQRKIARDHSLPRAARALCLGYLRYLLSYHRCVRLFRRNAPAPGAYFPGNARGSLPHRSLISATWRVPISSDRDGATGSFIAK